MHDIVVLSGGVSKGKFDFVPNALERLGVKKIFHQVNQRPGKPFWFGKSEKQTVFALPGNPVSTYLCFYRYIKPWLEQCLGLPALKKQAILATDFTFKPSLTYFLQVSVKYEQGKLLAYPDAGGGSGDFVNLKEVDGFLELQADRSDFKAGEIFNYYSFRK
jgi:molybdopterin molybdotransferase